MPKDLNENLLLSAISTLASETHGKKHNDFPKHYVILDEADKFHDLNGKEITVKEAWKMLSAFYKTTNGKVLGKIFYVLTQNLIKTSQPKADKTTVKETIVEKVVT